MHYNQVKTIKFELILLTLGNSLVPTWIRSAAQRVRRDQPRHAARRSRQRLHEFLRAPEDRDAAQPPHR